jgi:hypothetical protein
MTALRPTVANKTGRATANDSVMTPRHVARWIVERFSPTGTMLEPCCGDGAFLDAMPGADWCEITKGRDFLDYKGSVAWIITNPPFSIYDLFLLHAFRCADNVVFLAPLQKAFKSRRIEEAVALYGGLREVLMLGGGGAIGFPFGFPVGCLYYQRGYDGPTAIVRKFDFRKECK